MKILVTTASFGKPLQSYWAVQQSDRHTIEYRRYDDASFPYRTYSLTDALKSKFIKMLSHELNPGFDIYVWMDSTFSMYRTDTIDRLVQELKGCNLCLFHHAERSSIRDEARKIEKFVQEGFHRMVRRAEAEPIAEQVEAYLKDETFTDDKLFYGGVFLYTKELVEEPDNMMKAWYYEVCRHSIRDQISLPYVIHIYHPHYRVINANIHENQYFEFDRKLFSLI